MDIEDQDSMYELGDVFSNNDEISFTQPGMFGTDETAHKSEDILTETQTDQKTTYDLPKTNMDVVKRLLSNIEEVQYKNNDDLLSTFALSLKNNGRRVVNLYSTLVESDIYLPPLSCKRVTYKFLLGIVEKHYLVVKRSKVLSNPCPFADVVKAPTKVLKFQINTIAKLVGRQTGYELSNSFPRKFYIEVLYKIDPDNRVFPKKVASLTNNEEVKDLNTVVEEIVESFPVPETWRGLIRLRKDRIKTIVYGSLFGGALGAEKLQNQVASLYNNLGNLRKNVLAIKRDLKILKESIVFEGGMEDVIKLIN